MNLKCAYALTLMLGLNDEPEVIAVADGTVAYLAMVLAEETVSFSNGL